MQTRGTNLHHPDISTGTEVGTQNKNGKTSSLFFSSPMAEIIKPLLKYVTTIDFGQVREMVTLDDYMILILESADLPEGSRSYRTNGRNEDSFKRAHHRFRANSLAICKVSSSVIFSL